MKDKEKRKEILSNGTYRNYTEKRKKAFLSGHADACYKVNFDEDTGEIISTELNKEYFNISKEDLHECERIRKCKKEQREKIENHIKYLFDKSSYDLYFITFNFHDDALELSADTRKQKIRRLLNKFCADYILNIDYGEDKGREHYHAIICLKKNSYTDYLNEYNHIKIKEFDSYDYGNYDIQKIRTDEPDMKKLARYITKLTMHSIKVKQSYVSVKKGSDYQVQKGIIKNLKTDARNDKLFKPDYSDLLYANQL